MGKKGSNKNLSTANSGNQMSVTLREASTGKKHTNVKSALKLEHLKNLAVWASQDAAMPSLGAFFGHHFASSSEALATPVDPSLFTCQRCESILHPGNNCTIRIEKYKANARQKRKKNTSYPQNNIVYTCHFCSHRNIKRGTPRNKIPPKIKAHPKSTKRKISITMSSFDITKNVVVNTIAAPLGPTADNTNMGKMGIVEVSETLKVNDDSADINTIKAPQGPTTDDSNMGKMGILVVSETLKVSDDCVDINTIEASQGLATDDSNMGKMGIVEVNKTLTVNIGSADINAIEAPLGPTTDDQSGKTGIMEITETLEVKNDSGASCPTTPSTRPPLTLLEIKMGKKNRSKVKKKVSSETPNAEKSDNTSKRKRRKSWTSLKEIAENDSHKRSVNFSIPFSMQ